jgi:hypothetical protein
MKSIPEIRPTQIFTIASLTELLSLKAGTVPRELRLGRLKYAKRAGRCMILGRWIIEWIEGGLVRKANVETNGVATAELTR